MPVDFQTNEEMVRAARRALDQAGWDYLVGGAESETTMRRNRAAFDKWAFLPRVLVDVSGVDPATEFLGEKIRIPVMLAPVAGMQRIHPEAAGAVAEAAAEFGTLQTVSSLTDPGMEETAEASDGVKFFQMYIQGDWAWIKEMVARIKKAGYKAFVLTVDNARYSRRERPIVGRTALANLGPSMPGPGASVTWDLMDRIKDLVDMPIMVKGIATAADAAIAVEHGVDVVWVSNHGGRQLDHGRGTLDMLPGIVEAIGGKARIVLDGGVVRGSDVVKALALGANVVAIGKLQGWGLAAAGAEGVVRTLEILEDEILSAMALLGVNSIGELSRDYLERADPVAAPHEMSAWVNLPGERLL
jgi:glycolate oxidase